MKVKSAEIVLYHYIRELKSEDHTLNDDVENKTIIVTDAFKSKILPC